VEFPSLEILKKHLNVVLGAGSGCPCWSRGFGLDGLLQPLCDSERSFPRVD